MSPREKLTSLVEAPKKKILGRSASKGSLTVNLNPLLLPVYNDEPNPSDSFEKVFRFVLFSSNPHSAIPSQVLRSGETQGESGIYLPTCCLQQ